MSLDVAAAVGWLGTLTTICYLLPQVRTTCWLGLTAGLPPSRLWVGLANAQIWLIYGLVGGDPIQIASNACGGVLTLALLARVVPATVPSERHLLRWGALILGVLAATVALGVTSGTVGVGALGALSALLLLTPQLVSLLRNADQDVTGVSSSTCWLVLLCCVCWLTYGLMRGELAVWLPNVGSTACAVWTLVVLRRTTSTSTAERSTSILLVVPSVPYTAIEASEAEYAEPLRWSA